MKLATRRLLFLAAGVLAVAGCARRVPPAERVNVNNVKALRTALGGDATAATTEAGPAAEPTGFATIKGTFKLSGAAPQRTVLNIDKEREVCAPGGKHVLGEQFVVDPATGGIRDVVIYLSDKKFRPGDPKWEHPDFAAAASATLDYDQKNCIFLTHMQVIRASQRLRILNSDPVGHNTNISATPKANPFNQTIPSGGGLYDPRRNWEPFGVSCSIHPWMSANMLVRNNPYFAVTKPDGSFEIPNVPAGVELEFRVWQEKARFIPKITLGGERNEKFKGRFKVKLADGETHTIDAVVDAADLPK
jgi:hypothetical protein